MAMQLCQSCGKSRQSVVGRESTLVPGMPLLLCDTCANNGFEPRHLIVIVGRSKGWDSVRPFILNSKYVGDEITARELRT